MASNELDESFQCVEKSLQKGGPWCEANAFILESQKAINEILKFPQGKFLVRDVDFSCCETLTIDQDLLILFDVLDTIEEEHLHIVLCVKARLKEYIEKVMYPKLLALEMILVLQAYSFKGKPIIDLFYTFNENNDRVMQEPERFSFSMSGGFMSLFYKLAYLILIKKQVIDAENAEIFNLLQVNCDPKVPSCQMFGNKVFQDATVSDANIVINIILTIVS